MTYRTRQEIFDIAYLVLKGQGFERSANEGNMCMYRGEGGRKCAAGQLIAEDDYEESFEGYEAFQERITMACKVLYTDRGFLQTIQECHDTSTSPKDMQQKLIAFAQEYELKVPE